MTRRHAPTLVDPADVVRSQTDRALGVQSRQSLEERVAALERLMSRLTRPVAALVAPVTEPAPGPSGPPTIATLTAAGTTATVTITGTDETGLIQVVPGGAGIATGDLLTVTFALARPSTNYSIVLQENSAAARTAGSAVGPTSRGTTTFRIRTDSALTSGSTYQWFYFVRGY